MSNDDRLLTPQDVANYLLINVGSLYNLVNQRRIPHCHVCRLLRFSRRRIDEWLLESTIEEQRFDNR